MTTTAITCPHCGAANVPEAAFCESCGKALPTGAASGPRVVSATAMPATGAGRSMLSDELTKTMKRAATALMWVAILQTLLGPVLLFVQKAKLERENPGMVYEVGPLAYAIVFGIAALFWGLFFWARRSPLPAAIVGLVLFITLHVVDAVSDPMSLARGWLVKILVVVALWKAIQAGLQYRRLSEQQQAAAPGTVPGT